MRPREERRHEAAVVPRLASQEITAAGTADKFGFARPAGVLVPPAATLDPAAVLSDAIRAVHARATAGDIRHVATLAPLLKAWAECRDVAGEREQARQQLQAAGEAIRLMMDAARDLCWSLQPLVGPVQCQRMWNGYCQAFRATVDVPRQGGAPSPICPPLPPLAGFDGMPYAVWDRARMEVLHEEIDDEVIWQRLLARMAAEPQRFYLPWAQPIA